MTQAKNAGLKRVVMVAATYGPKALGTFFLCSSLAALLLFSIFSSKEASFSMDAFHPSTAMLALISYCVGLVPSVFAGLIFTALAITAVGFGLIGFVGIYEGALLGAASGAFVGWVISGSVGFTVLCVAATLFAGLAVGWKVPLNGRS